MADNDATPTDERVPEAYEEQNVHEVYQQIAEHFSSTRYKVCSILSSISIYLRDWSHSYISRGPLWNVSSESYRPAPSGSMWDAAMAST